jgi:hypothetical protein
VKNSQIAAERQPARVDRRKYPQQDAETQQERRQLPPGPGPRKARADSQHKRQQHCVCGVYNVIQILPGNVVHAWRISVAKIAAIAAVSIRLAALIGGCSDGLPPNAVEFC